MRKKWKTYKKLHKWPGLIISFILLYYAVTGIIMNHRDLLSGVDFSRKIMPGNYGYHNWNNAALKGDIIINKDSILVYGNIGIWLTDSTFRNYTSFNSGFSAGSDNRKIYDVLRTREGNIYAATLRGLYGYDRKTKSWKKFKIDDREERFTGLEIIGDTLYAINRSHLFRGKSTGPDGIFEKIRIPAPPGFDNKITLFQTIWQIHSGEILGLPGKIYVDILGVIVIFLSVTGIIWFFFPGLIRRKVRLDMNTVLLTERGKWSLRWHNKVGAWTFVLLIILFLTGMFLRPPLLIAIGKSRVLPIKYSHLDQPNPWHDKLRDILYDPENSTFLLAASDGIYRMNDKDFVPVPFNSQPPVSVMGITVFEKNGNSDFLIGSFSGLYSWNPRNSGVIDIISGQPYRESGTGRPVGDYAVTGLINDAKKNKYFVDYGSGIRPLNQGTEFPEMPENILRESKISLWSLCLEIHTGRVFENILGVFYILIVPLVGIAGIIVVYSGYILWRRKYRKREEDNLSESS